MNRVKVIEFAHRWFTALNNHVPVNEAVAFLDPKSVTMKFPEATLTSVAEFRAWYKTVTHKFFDQNHRILQIDVKAGKTSADVFVVVNWTAHAWDPPAAFSKRIDMDAYQNWRVRKCEDGRLVISRYEVAGMTDNA